MTNNNFKAAFSSTSQEFNIKTGRINQGFNTTMGQINTPVNTSKPKIGFVDLTASSWVRSNDCLYSQIVNIDGVTENSQVDLMPDVEQLVAFYEKDITFVTENDGGIVTIYVIGQKPSNDYTIQVTITEVVT